MNSRPPDEKQKILIVDDDPVIRKILATASEKQGHVVRLCDNAESAWDIYLKETPRLIVLDWLLPGMDGVALCKKIRQTPLGRYVIILMVTGQDQPEALEEALRAGVSYYMTKPVRKGFFDAWLAAAEERLRELLRLEKHEKEVLDYREELEAINRQLEGAISRANQMTREAEQAYVEINQIFKTVAGGILLVDKECNILRHNESFLQMAGITAEEAVREKCYEVFHSCLCHTRECPIVKIENGAKRLESEIEKTLPDGSFAYYYILSTPFRGPVGELLGVVEHITDITARKKAEKALRESERRYKELSTVDELTGLFNKRHFNKHLALEAERASRYGHPLSLLLLDIDNFKQHNDTYGHADGDRVLARLGKIIAVAIRANDMGCRYGGEEFVVILPVTNGQNAVVVAERIRQGFAAEEFHPAPEITVRKTISIGIAQYAADEEPGLFLERADRNMYLAKKSGKNRSVYQE